MKKQYKILLWDIDDTLLDFGASERAALEKCFQAHGISLTAEDVAVYSGINRDYWALLEQKKIEKTTMLCRRFDDFIEYLSADGVTGDMINQKFQVAVGDYAVFREGALELCQQMQGVKKQYAITNGTAVAQRRKLKNTGLDQIFDDVFISDLIGVQKPDEKFFDYVQAHIPNFQKEDALVIGDSLTSDMRGANNAGIDCCWVNPKGNVNSDESIHIDYEIQSLGELRAIIG